MSNNNSSALSSILSNKLITTMTVLLLISIVAFVPAFFLYQKQNGDNQEYLRHAGELRVLSQELAKNASEAGQGSNLAFASLKKSQQSFDRNLRAIMEGDAASNLPSADIAAAELGALNKTWKSVKGSSQVILSGKEAVLYLHKVTSDLAEKIPSIQQEYDDVVEILLEVRAPSDQIAIAQRQTLLAERIVSSANKVLEGGENAVYSAESFEENAVKFGEVLDGMINGNDAMQIRRVIDEEALDSLSATRDLFEFVKNNVKEILDKSPELFQVTQAVDVTFTESGKLLQQLNVVNTVLLEEGGANVILQTVSFALVGLAVIFIIIIATLLYAQTQTNLKEEAETNEANQNAIMRLLDELADLGDGDLSVQATVTEDFTGAIADAFNFSVEQMRSLVSNINDAAVQVSSAAQETQATAMHLAEASDHQAQEIAGASAAVNEMAVSIDQVSANASESSSVAERSVAIANKGGEVVRNTISGMDNIRGQIQETSKRIKRLGESTQEIGDIVSLINDIADQTNILALNASIQASMAGDAGRGFAVVADEVQRLAERSGAATKQIEALVKTIQNDTNEAVISMEQTTTEVVKGAHLAQDAGVSLEEIETVSTNLAELIQNISNAARQQASSAGHISNTMNVIQEITSQTSSGTNATAASIGNLADMANRMRRSVEGFNLPEQETTDTIN